MLPTKIPLIFIILFVSIFFLSCDREDIGCGDEDNYCFLAEYRELEDTKYVIDNFLEELENESEEESLQKLIIWLECKPCIKKAELKCISCILTYPAQSEITIDFLIDGEEFTRILDIWMSTPLRAGGYHF